LSPDPSEELIFSFMSLFVRKCVLFSAADNDLHRMFHDRADILRFVLGLWQVLDASTMNLALGFPTKKKWSNRGVEFYEFTE